MPRFRKTKRFAGHKIVKKRHRVRGARKTTRVGRTATMGAGSIRPTIQRGPYPFGNSYLVKLVYGVNFAITTAGSSSLSASYLHRLNSLFDPDQSGTGHQPYMYDQLTSMYKRYQVYAASYRLTCTAPNQNGILCGLAVRDAANTTASMASKTVDYIVERRLTTLRSVNSTGSQKTMFKGYVKMQQVFGITKTQYGAAEEDKYDAAIGATPTETVVLDAFIIDPNALVATASMRFIGTITYYARMFDFIGPSQS